MDKRSKHALWSLMFHAAYSAYHILFGVSTRSWWLFTIGIYYLILCVLRFSVLRTKERWRFTVGFTGVMLMVLSLPLVGTVILSFLKDRGTAFPLVVMLAIAVYAFTKITLATYNWIKARGDASAKRITLRNISFADAFVSIFSLQRSMLVSFEGMTEAQIQVMNMATGSGVCVIVFLLGFNLLRNRKISEGEP
jgi:hypothetical protein